jgi:plastocyanin
MTCSRRHALVLLGGFLAAQPLPAASRAERVRIIVMHGTARGERTWFAPAGLAVPPGARVRFVNRDAGNSHTSTAYHPDVFDRARRIPAAASPWDSGFLLPGEGFDVVLTAPGVYDYYCIPHEMAGMAGRIVVGTPEDPGWEDAAPASDDLPEKIAGRVPSVAEIIQRGRIGEAGE